MGEVWLPDAEDRLAILARFCSAVQSLHDAGLVVGDMSFGNVLWTTDPMPSVMLLDCDGIGLEGASHGLPQYDTLDWNDPLADAGLPADRDRDRYKLSLAILRVLTRNLSARPDTSDHGRLHLPDGFNPEQFRALFGAAAGPVGTRPTAAQWRSALDGRDTVAVTRPQVRGRSGPAPKPGLMVGRQPRQTRPVSPTNP